MFQWSGPIQMSVWDKMTRGLSTRNYKAAVQDFQNAYGIEKSAVRENFIEASREKVKELMERPLGGLRLCAIVIDGTPLKERQRIAALGLGCDGTKTVLGLREGATENTEVVSALLDDLAARGVDFSIPCLYILDGAKALAAAVGKHAGSAALIQRCILHKQRNEVGHLPEQYQADVKRKLKNAYAMADYDKAKESLQKLHRELMHLNPSAARSLEEGTEETLTVHKLRVPDQLRRTLCCTNIIEPAFPMVETVCRNVMDGTQLFVVKSETEGRAGRTPGQPARTRECKFGAVFTQTTVDDQGRPLRDEHSTTYVGAIGSAEEFGLRLYTEAWNRGWERASVRVVMGDGSHWIWNIADQHFPGAIQIVDLYHARQHLWKAARKLYPADDIAQKRWLRCKLDWLDNGKIEKLVAALRKLADAEANPELAEALANEAEYFATNRDRMSYPDFRKKGLFVGSGVIEAGCKTVIGSRLKRSGMFWTVLGADAIIALRCCCLSGKFESYWAERAA